MQSAVGRGAPGAFWTRCASLQTSLLVDTPRAARIAGGPSPARYIFWHRLSQLPPSSTPCHSRVADDELWGLQVATLRDLPERPRLTNRWPLPDLPDSALRRALAGHDAAVRAVRIAPDGAWLATGANDGSIRIWDTASEQAPVILTGSYGVAVAIAPDGAWLAAGDSDGRVRIWDTANWHEHSVLRGHSGPVSAVAFSPDGSRLATCGSGDTVRIWDTASWRESPPSRPQTPDDGVAFRPDGRWLATASTSGNVRIWDTAPAEASTSVVHGSFNVRWRSRPIAAGCHRQRATGPCGSGTRLTELRKFTHRPSRGAVAIARTAAGWPPPRDRTVRIWDAVADPGLRPSPATRPASRGGDRPDGRWLATASERPDRADLGRR